MYLVYISCFDLMELIVPLNVIVWNNVCQCSEPPVFKPLLLTVGKRFALKKNLLYKIIDSVSVFGLDFKTCPNLYDLESNVLSKLMTVILMTIFEKRSSANYFPVFIMLTASR